MPFSDEQLLLLLTLFQLLQFFLLFLFGLMLLAVIKSLSLTAIAETVELREAERRRLAQNLRAQRIMKDPAKPQRLSRLWNDAAQAAIAAVPEEKDFWK